jgi:hypothetical protein
VSRRREVVKLSDIKIVRDADRQWLLTRGRPRVRVRRAALGFMDAIDKFENRATPTTWAALVTASRSYLWVLRADRTAERAKAEQQVGLSEVAR